MFLHFLKFHLETVSECAAHWKETKRIACRICKIFILSWVCVCCCLQVSMSSVYKYGGGMVFHTIYHKAHLSKISKDVEDSINCVWRYLPQTHWKCSIVFPLVFLSRDTSTWWSKSNSVCSSISYRWPWLLAKLHNLFLQRKRRRKNALMDGAQRMCMQHK